MLDRVEPFTERFNRLTDGLGDTELAHVLGMTVWGVRKLRQGDTQSLKLDQALRLCRRLGVSPWDLGGETAPTGIEPGPSPAVATPTPDVLAAAIDALRADLVETNEELARAQERIAALEDARHGREPKRRLGGSA